MTTNQFFLFFALIQLAPFVGYFGSLTIMTVRAKLGATNNTLAITGDTCDVNDQ